MTLGERLHRSRWAMLLLWVVVLVVGVAVLREPGIGLGLVVMALGGGLLAIGSAMRRPVAPYEAMWTAPDGVAERASIYPVASPPALIVAIASLVVAVGLVLFAFAPEPTSGRPMPALVRLVSAAGAVGLTFAGLRRLARLDQRPPLLVVTDRGIFYGTPEAGQMALWHAIGRIHVQTIRGGMPFVVLEIVNWSAVLGPVHTFARTSSRAIAGMDGLPIATSNLAVTSRDLVELVRARRDGAIGAATQ